MDGSPNATWDGRLAYSAPQDAVQEVRVKAFDSDAAFGHTGGGTLNQVIKTGTNDLHGSLWEQNQPNTLTANDFFNNAKGVARPVTHFNQYGVTAGGPVYIPKVFNGRNKLFWFFAWEAMKDGQPNPTFTTVPTAAERTGDFSRLLAADGASTQLYDPYSAHAKRQHHHAHALCRQQDSHHPVEPHRPQLPEVLPAAQPGRPGSPRRLPELRQQRHHQRRLQQRAGPPRLQHERQKPPVHEHPPHRLQPGEEQLLQNAAEGSVLYRNNWGGSLDEVYTINSTNVVDVRLNFTRMAEIHASPSTGFDPTALGFPSYIAANSQYLQMPVISFNSNTNFQNLEQPAAATVCPRSPSSSSPPG